MRFALSLFLTIAVTLAAASPAPPPAPDVTLCCPPGQHRQPQPEREPERDPHRRRAHRLRALLRIQRRDHLLLRRELPCLIPRRCRADVISFYAAVLANWVVVDARQLMHRIPVDLLIGAGLVP
ncbi:hypothetical protein B0H19DRAFT_1061353 [Mycena capillaripes]|nr:hypothetical protein B0H19DRAFT_1061353 [Mycena capillaripes]